MRAVERLEDRERVEERDDDPRLFERVEPERPDERDVDFWRGF